MQAVKNHLRDNRGATSVLIMIMMIILMAFGIAALTTSVASRKLAQKNANWLAEYYALQGEAETMYAHLDDALNLAEAGEDLSRIEDLLNQFLRENANCSFQKTEAEHQPFIININVKEPGREVPKEIQMGLVLAQGEGRYYLKVIKWEQHQAEIFDPEDEPRFSDIKMESAGNSR